MAKKLTKKEIAELIVSEFPDRGDDAVKLVEDHTLTELEALLADLRAGDSDDSEQNAADKEPEASEKVADGPKLYKLADSSKEYHGIEFTIKGDEEKPLPKKRDAELERRINAGYLIEVGD